MSNNSLMLESGISAVTVQQLVAAALQATITPAVVAVATIMNALTMDADRSSDVVDLRGKRFWCVSLAAPSNTHVGTISVYLGNANPPVDTETIDGITYPANGVPYNQTFMVETGGAAYGYVKSVFTSGTGALTALSYAF